MRAHSLLRLAGLLALVVAVAPLRADDDPPKKERTAKDYLERGRVFLVRGDAEQALADFTRAIELDPKSAEAYRDRALVRWGTAVTSRNREDLDKALEDYNEAVK